MPDIRLMMRLPKLLVIRTMFRWSMIRMAISFPVPLFSWPKLI